MFSVILGVPCYRQELPIKHISAIKKATMQKTMTKTMAVTQDKGKPPQESLMAATSLS